MCRMQIPRGRDTWMNRRTDVAHMAAVATTHMLDFTVRARERFIEVERMQPDGVKWRQMIGCCP